jgi:hypothetical protein
MNNNLNTYTQLQQSVAGLATITDKKLAVISEKMVEMDRANHTAGRSDTQTTNQLMTLTMLSDSPYRSLRQCLANIENKRNALDEAFWKMKKKKLQIAQWYKKGDEMSVIRAQEAEHNMLRQKDYIDGAFKEIATFQCAYDDIKEANNIPDDWDEMAAEQEEITHHLRTAFKQAHRQIVSNGVLDVGNMEYLEQFGVHIQTAIALIKAQVALENEMSSKGKFPTVTHLYEFLDKMVELFKDSHKEVMKHIGLKELIREDFLYLEDKDDS